MPPSLSQSLISFRPVWMVMGTERSAWPVSSGPEGAASDLWTSPDGLRISFLLSVVALGEHAELRKSLLPPLIIHTAATPMSLPKSSSTGVGEALGSGSRRTSSSGSAEPGAAHHEMKSPVRKLTLVPHCRRLAAQQDEGLKVGRSKETAPGTQAGWSSQC